MTYSRPGIGRVNIGDGGSRSNVPKVSLPSRSFVSANGAYRDYRSPEQAGLNAKRQYEGIQALLDFATSEEVTKVVRDQIDNNAKREAGKAIDSYPAIATTGTDDPDAIAALNGLSPRAKSFVAEARATNAVSAYGPALEAEFASRPIIYAAGNTPEQQEARAREIAAAKASAREASGLSGLTPFQLTQNADSLMKVDGQMQGFAYKTRLKHETDLAQVGLIQGAASGLVDGWGNLSDIGADDRAGDQPLTAGWRATLKAVVDTSSNNFGPKGQALVLAGGISEALNRITDPQEKLEFLQRTLAEAKTPMLGADEKTDIFSIPLGKTGSSIKDILESQVGEAEIAADKSLMGKTLLEMEQLRAGGNAEGARALGLKRIELLNDPSQIPGFIRDIETLTARTTPQMRKNGYAMFDRQLNGESAETLVKEMIQAPVGTYRPEDISSMFVLARQNNGVNKDFERKNTAFNNAKRDNQDAFDVGFDSYTQYTGGEGLTDTEGKLNAKGKVASANFKSDVRERFFELQAEAEPGKFDPNAALITAINETVGAAKEQAGSGADVIATPQQAYVSWGAQTSKILTETAQKNGGRLDSQSIPEAAIAPGTLKAWQAANPGKTFSSLTALQKEKLLARSIQSFQKYDPKTGTFKNYSQQEAVAKAREMLEGAEQAAGSLPVPGVVPETPEEEKQLRTGRMTGYGRAQVEGTVKLLQRAVEWSTTPQSDPYNFNKIFNNGGLGDGAMSYVDGFLNMVVGAPPAYAGQLDYGTPEGLATLRQSWQSGQQGLNTAPMPQVAASTPVRFVPTAINSDNHELFVMVGVAEGTRTASGGYTKAYYGHRDAGDGNLNRGTVSGGRGTQASPQMVDRRWMGTLTNVMQRMRPYLIVYGLQPGTQGYNRMMFNLIDLTVQSPAAAQDFAGKLIQLKNSNWTVEAIAKARADSYINPQTGRLEASGFGNSYQRLFQDQRSRAGVYDYRRRI